MALPAHLYGPRTGGIIFGLLFIAIALGKIFNLVLQNELRKGRLTYGILTIIMGVMSI